MELLIPCAGKSSRFKTEKPKYLLTMPSGELMVEAAVKPFIKKFDRILFAILREHEEMFQASSVLQKIFRNAKVLILDELTRGQAETVLKMLKHFKVRGPFYVKDSDSYFEPLTDYNKNKNYISVCDAKKAPHVKLYNKSFVDINDQNYVTRTSEKEIMSNFFSCGGYFFSKADDFIENFVRYQAMQIRGEFFISNIINFMIDSGHIFYPMKCTEYEDWGTYEDWLDYGKKISTYLIDVDGVIFENGSEFWDPKWGKNKVSKEVRDKINELYKSENYIVLITTRPESYRKITEAQLRKDNVNYHQLIMNVHHGKRILINDFNNTNPYPSAIAINTKRNSFDFIEKLDNI